MVVAGCACIVAGGIALTTDAKLRASREAAADGDLALAADEARAAASIQPWAAAPRLQLALVQEENDPAAAERALGEAIERAPEDWRLWYALTRLRATSATAPVPFGRCGARAPSLRPRPTSAACSGCKSRE